MFRIIVQKTLEHYVKRYLKKHQIKLVAVVGSVGKTGTKLAVATVLGEKYRVRSHDGNHNTHLSAPLAILGVQYPDDVHSFAQWRAVFAAARLRIHSDKDVDVVVQELGTDKPGDIRAFGRYLKPDIAVVTAVGLEHMEFFKNLEAVAREELSVAKFSKLTVVNRDDVDTRFAKFADTHTIDTYGTTDKAEYRIEVEFGIHLDGVMGRFITPEWEPIAVNLQLVGDHQVKAAAAAGLVGARLGLNAQEIATGMAKIRPVKGRMNLLRGVNGLTIIDDSYNSSPMAVAAAFKTVYSLDAPQRIAILGSMNEFGELSPRAHSAVGELCDPGKLEWLVTVGADAANYLAPAAQKKGCQVKTFNTPYEAGGFVHSIIKKDGVVLVKGSQNAIFTEEATKILLHDATDEQYLVRQDPEWMAKKQKTFDMMDTSTEDV